MLRKWHLAGYASDTVRIKRQPDTPENYHTIPSQPCEPQYNPLVQALSRTSSQAAYH